MSGQVPIYRIWGHGLLGHDKLFRRMCAIRLEKAGGPGGTDGSSVKEGAASSWAGAGSRCLPCFCILAVSMRPDGFAREATLPNFTASARPVTGTSAVFSTQPLSSGGLKRVAAVTMVPLASPCSTLPGAHHRDAARGQQHPATLRLFSKGAFNLVRRAAQCAELRHQPDYHLGLKRGCASPTKPGSLGSTPSWSTPLPASKEQGACGAVWGVCRYHPWSALTALVL